MNPGVETPWDSTPVIGISKKLGCVFLKPNIDGTGWVEYDPILPTEKYKRDHDILVIHKNHLQYFSI
jgi:hypothetical protein